MAESTLSIALIVVGLLGYALLTRAWWLAFNQRAPWRLGLWLACLVIVTAGYAYGWTRVAD